MRRLVLGAALVAGCPQTDRDASQDEAPAADDKGEDKASDDAFVREAHAAALARLKDKARTALVHADPIAAASIGLGSLSPRPLGRSRREALRGEVDAAIAESEGIDSAALSPEDGVLRATVVAALDAVRTDLQVRPALRRDPTVLTDDVAALVLAVQTRLAARQPDGCAEALTEQASEVEAALGQIGAASPASASEAVRALTELRATVTELSGTPAVDAARDELDAALATAQTRLEAIVAHLPEATETTWKAGVPGATEPEAVLRLPDRLGKGERTRRLADEEALSTTPSVHVRELTLVLQRLTAMKQRLSPEPDTEASPPTTARCEAAWAKVAAWAKDNEAVPGATLQCSAALARLGDAPRTDAALTVALFELGVVEPTRAVRRRAVEPVLGLVGGRMGPAGQQHALTISGLMEAKLPAAASLAIDGAREDLCVALAALLEHGEMEADADARRSRLRTECPEFPADALIEPALAHPRRALAPIGLALIGKGPAEAVALSRFWWVPLGMVMPLAIPQRAEPVRPGAVKVEALTPDPT